jgi:hypothetical protein
VRDRELVSTAAANSSISAIYDTPEILEPFKTYVSLTGMERASSADSTVNNENLKNTLSTSLATASSPVGFDQGRSVLMMQESIGLNTSHSELNETGGSSTVVKEWCTQSVTTEDQLCNHLNLVITQERQTSAGFHFHSAGEAESVSLQFVSAADSTRKLDSPSQLSEEPFLKTVSEFEIENRTHASIADTHREIQRLVSPPEAGSVDRENTPATDFEAVLNSPLWASLGPDFGEEFEAYDVIQPEPEESKTNNETAKRWDALFTDFRQQTADT